jgi:predicted membrane protein
MAVYFQAGLQAAGKAPLFMKSIMLTMLIQLALFYPINKFAAGQAKREVDSCADNLTAEELKSFRTSRLIGDMIKAAVFIFYTTFILRAPVHLFIYSLIIFSFLLTTLTYFQCYNFAAKKAMKEKS